MNGLPWWAHRKNWRFAIARMVDNLPGQCWADLVTWAQDSPREAIDRADSWLGLSPLSNNRQCRDATGGCYCGKLRPPGVEQ